LRLRLARGEVESLRDTGVVTARTRFPGGQEFRYRVESSPASVNVGALFSDGAITLRLPEATVLAWANSEQVSIVGEQGLDDGEPLSLLVEKDFACLVERPGEDDTDMFPNPDAGTVKGQC